MPRYGLSAALIDSGIRPSSEMDLDEETLTKIAIVAIEAGLNYFMLGPNIKNNKVHYRYISGHDVDPGSKSGQVSTYGYYTGVHILTGNNAAGIVKEAKVLIGALKSESKRKPYELKRSFAPMVAKINAGKQSMSNPKVDIFRAAFTAISSLTRWKPAAYLGENTGLIPDIPFYDHVKKKFPLHEFITVFKMLSEEGNDGFSADYDGKKFKRPSIFRGNFPEAPQAMDIGSVPLISAIGKWVEKQKIHHRKAEEALKNMQDRPIYVVSDSKICQEFFGHHLINLGLDGQLHEVLKTLKQVSLIGLEERNKFNDPKWKLFTKQLVQFIRFFSKPSFANFLSYRATYPHEFIFLLKSYFMDNPKYNEEVINSAISYGKALNRAAYISAKEEIADDQRKGNSSRGLYEYKHRVLLQLEGIIQSAKTHTELVSRLNSQVGRLTMQDIPADAQLFLNSVVTHQLDLEESKHLITAFMRLNPKHKGKEMEASIEEEVSTQDNSSDSLPMDQ